MKNKESNQKSLRISDKELQEALKEMGTYVDISESDLEKLFNIVFKHIHKKLQISHTGEVSKRPPVVNKKEIAFSALSSFAGIGLCAFLSSYFFEPLGSTLLIGSFGASAVLVYAAIRSPLAQPRNLIGGHIISAIAGVACYNLFSFNLCIAAAAAVSIAILAMLSTNTLHPPGGATALIAVIGGTEIHELGYFYALFPVAAGAAVLLLVALAVNKILPDRKYPEYWF